MAKPSVATPVGGNDLVWQLVEKLDESRRHPRISLDIKVALRTDGGAKFSANVINISPDGLQIRCIVETAHLLHPNGGKIEPKNSPFANVALALPVEDGIRTLAARCQMLYLSTVNTEPRCVVGLCFVKMDLQTERIVNEFFSHQLATDAGDYAAA